MKCLNKNCYNNIPINSKFKKIRCKCWFMYRKYKNTIEVSAVIDTYDLFIWIDKTHIRSEVYKFKENKSYFESCNTISNINIQENLNKEYKKCYSFIRNLIFL